MEVMMKFRIESGLQNFHIHTPLVATLLFTIIIYKWITIIRLWWPSQWLVTYGRHLSVTIVYMWRNLQTTTQS